MGASTEISWTDATWSALRVRVKSDAGAIAKARGYTSLIHIAEKMAGRAGPHCEHVSPGCENCYAETNNHRCLPVNGTGLPYDRRSRDLVESFVDEKILLQPLKWKTGRRIFVENQSDLFGEWVTDEQIDRIFAVMSLCPQHTFQVLTKRPERMLSYCAAVTFERLRAWMNRSADGGEHRPGAYSLTSIAHRNKKGTLFEFKRSAPPPLPNVWLGVSVENQETADARIPLLLKTPAAKRFVSYEPALGPITFRWAKWDDWSPHARRKTQAPSVERDGRLLAGSTDELDGLRMLDWIVAGGESGPGARPMHPAWAEAIRDQCVSAGVPFHFKQWGKWGAVTVNDRHGAIVPNEKRETWARIGGGVCKRSEVDDFAWPMVSVGKKASGHLLDGREWREFPK